VYIGTFEDGKLHGHGTYTRANGDVYIGEFKDGKRHGPGSYRWANRDMYVGEWKNGKAHGLGTQELANGDVYIGYWKNDKYHGPGRYTQASGDVYFGEWNNDKYHGVGMYKWVDGDIYTGLFKDDTHHGRGTYKYASNGDEYLGIWEHGKRCGKFLSLPTSKIHVPEQEIQENERRCIICLNDFRQGDERTLLPCKHGFHTECVNTWFSTTSSCPMCRSWVCKNLQ
jgi:hypothetical protein